MIIGDGSIKNRRFGWTVEKRPRAASVQGKVRTGWRCAVTVLGGSILAELLFDFLAHDEIRIHQLQPEIAGDPLALQDVLAPVVLIRRHPHAARTAIAQLLG